VLRSSAPFAVEAGLVRPERRRTAQAQRLSVGAAAAVAALAAFLGSGLGGDQRTTPLATVRMASAGNVDLATLRAGRRAELHLAESTLANPRIRVVELD
jgi:hypothetical protein